MDEDIIDIKMERAIKLWFLFGLLMFRKPLGAKPVKNFEVKRTLSDRLDLILSKDFVSLVATYEADIVHKKSMPQPHNNSTSAEKQNRRSVKEAINLMRGEKVGKAQQILLSKGCADPKDPSVHTQLQGMHPTRKESISNPTPEQEVAVPRAQIDREVFQEVVTKL